MGDAHLPAFRRERPDLHHRVARPLLIQDEMPSDAMPGGAFQLVVYPGPIEVGWNVGPVGLAARPATTRLLFDRVGIPIAEPAPLTAQERRAQAEHWLTFFWAMAPIAVKYAGRGQTDRAVSQIALLTRATIALRRLVAQPWEPNPWLPGANRPLEPELAARLPRIGRTIDPFAAREVIRALCAEIERLHPALAELNVPVPAGMPGETRALAAIAEATIGAGTRNRGHP